MASKKEVFIFDLDGTLNNNGRSVYHRGEKTLEDGFNPILLSILRGLRVIGYDVVILSGRRDTWLKDTKQWLSRENINPLEIILKPAKEERSTLEWKVEKLGELEKRYKIQMIFEDRTHHASVFRGLGLQVADVAGNFFKDDRQEFINIMTEK